MPYVPSRKTDGKSTDREVLDAALERLACKVAAEITNNASLKKAYRLAFCKIASGVYDILNNYATAGEVLEWDVAKAIYETGAKYGYGGAFLGEFNYAITRFIQRVPQIKVVRGDWKMTDELRYWLYAETVAALVYASRHTEDLDIAVDGVFIDVKDEYKWRVNRSYETAQILKSGDCYDTPYYNKLVEVVDESGNHIGHVYVDVKRSEETLHVDMLRGRLILSTEGGKHI